MFDRFIETPGGSKLAPTKDNFVFLLRNLGTLMPGFQWDYSSPCFCAMGVAHDYWGIGQSSASVGEAFNIDRMKSYNIFNSARAVLNKAEPTALDIARMIEECV